IEKVEAFGGRGTRIGQVLCTEYDVGVGIGWHRDKPHFDRIFGLSLGSACKFRLPRPARKSWDRLPSTPNRARSTSCPAPRNVYGSTGSPPLSRRGTRSRFEPCNA